MNIMVMSIDFHESVIDNFTKDFHEAVTELRTNSWKLLKENASN